MGYGGEGGRARCGSPPKVFWSRVAKDYKSKSAFMPMRMDLRRGTSAQDVTERVCGMRMRAEKFGRARGRRRRFGGASVHVK